MFFLRRLICSPTRLHIFDQYSHMVTAILCDIDHVTLKRLGVMTAENSALP